jgi:lysophospholipid acyltransferase (LPLAT)-like uncharacterized protein
MDGRMTEATFQRLRPLLYQAYWAASTPKEAKMVAVLFALFGLDDVCGNPQRLHIAVAA